MSSWRSARGSLIRDVRPTQNAMFDHESRISDLERKVTPTSPEAHEAGCWMGIILIFLFAGYVAVWCGFNHLADFPYRYIAAFYSAALAPFFWLWQFAFTPFPNINLLIHLFGSLALSFCYYGMSSLLGRVVRFGSGCRSKQDFQLVLLAVFLAPAVLFVCWGFWDSIVNEMLSDLKAWLFKSETSA